MQHSQTQADLASLRWLLCSPPLLAHGQAQGFGAAEMAAIEAWLANVEQDSGALTAWLATARANCGAQPLRIGRLAERLLEFFLRFGPLHRLVACNVPVRSAALAGSDRTTVGELDFLVTSPGGEAQHWELAVKYFLCHATDKVVQVTDFIGPDAAETLERKLHKLFDKQLQHAVPAPFSALTWQRFAYTRGWMFYRFGQPVPTCAALNPAHLRGSWLPLEEIHRLNPSHRYVELARSQWLPRLCGVHPAHSLQLPELGLALTQAWGAQRDPNSARSPIARIAKAQQQASKPSARLVAELVQSADGVTWHECERHFVLPERPCAAPIANGLSIWRKIDEQI